MNQKNSLGLDSCFKDLEDPLALFTIWLVEAEKKEINDPNALSLATTNSKNEPSVRMVLLKGLSKKGFVFYTNLNSPKSDDLKKNPKAEMCFHWKSLQRQIRIFGNINQVSDEEADAYFNSRPYESRIGAWASDQSKVMNKREEFLKKIDEIKNKYKDKKQKSQHTKKLLIIIQQIDHVGAHGSPYPGPARAYFKTFFNSSRYLFFIMTIHFLKRPTIAFKSFLIIIRYG